MDGGKYFVVQLQCHGGEWENCTMLCTLARTKEILASRREDYRGYGSRYKFRMVEWIHDDVYDEVREEGAA